MKLVFRIATLVFLLIASISVNAQDERLQIVASFSILGDVVSNVAANVADVTTTMPVGADPHSFQPVPADLIALANADVVFISGALFEEGLLEAIENAGADMNIIIASSCVKILAFGDDEHADEEHEYDSEMQQTGSMAELCEQHASEIEGIHDTNDNHAHDEHNHDHDDHDAMGYLYAINCGEGAPGNSNEHNHGACDPHVWMNPHNVMLWTLLIRDTLINLDPANAEIYTANAGSYITELDILTHDFLMPMVATVTEDNRLLITNHHTLGYFADTFGFEITTTVIPGGSTLSEPGAADVARLIDLINETGVPAIFAETTLTDSITQTIADETGASLYVLYSGSLSDADGEASTYLDYMRYNVTTIVEALGGGM